MHRRYRDQRDEHHAEVKNARRLVASHAATDPQHMLKTSR
jgi:hypothetical protein